MLDNCSFCGDQQISTLYLMMETNSIIENLSYKKPRWIDEEASTIPPLEPQISHNRQCLRQASQTRSRTANRCSATFTIYERIWKQVVVAHLKAMFWAGNSRRISGNLTEIRRDYSNTSLQPYRQSTGAAKLRFLLCVRLQACRIQCFEYKYHSKTEYNRNCDKKVHPLPWK